MTAAHVAGSRAAALLPLSAIVGGAAAGYLTVVTGVLLPIGDQGTLLHGASRVAQGAVPYRDFADLANPLSYYWLGAWFAAFGIELSVARTLLVLTGASSAALVFLLAARAYGPRTALPAAALTTVLGIPFWPGTSHHWDSNLFFLLVLSAVAAWQSRGRAFYAGVAGVAAACTAGFMINKGGLALFVAFVTVCLSHQRPGARAAIAVLAGFAVPVVLGWVVFAAHGAASDFFYVNLVFPATRYASVDQVPYAFGFWELAWEGPFSILQRLLPRAAAMGVVSALALPLGLVAAVPVAAALLLAYRRYTGRPPLSDEEVLLWVGGTALWLAELHRWDLYHLLYGAPLVLASVMGELSAHGQGRRWRQVLVRAITACAIALGAWQGALAMAAQERQQTRRGDIRVHARDEALQFLLEHTRPGDQVFVYPYNPMYYFLADVRNPTRYGILMYGYNTDAQFHEAVADLERTRPRYVLWDDVVSGENLRRWYPTYVHPRGPDLIMEPYLDGRYTAIGTKGRFRVLERTDASRP